MVPLSVLFNISVLFGCIQTSLYGFRLSLSISLSHFHYSASIKKLQEQNESHQASRAKMAEGMALALEKKDQVNLPLCSPYSHYSQCWFMACVLISLYPLFAGMDGEDSQCGKSKFLTYLWWLPVIGYFVMIVKIVRIAWWPHKHRGFYDSKAVQYTNWVASHLTFFLRLVASLSCLGWFYSCLSADSCKQPVQDPRKGGFHSGHCVENAKKTTHKSLGLLCAFFRVKLNCC